MDTDAEHVGKLAQVLVKGLLQTGVNPISWTSDHLVIANRIPPFDWSVGYGPVDSRAPTPSLPDSFSSARCSVGREADDDGRGVMAGDPGPTDRGTSGVRTGPG